MFPDYDRIIFFDTETTGTNHMVDVITELAYIVTEKNTNLIQRDNYIQIDDNQEYSPEAEKITGITREFLKTNGLPKEQVIKEFYNYLFEKKKTLLIAHNMAFDSSFVASEFARLGLQWKHQVDMLDTLTVYKDFAPYPHKLSDAIDFFKLKDVQNSHRAIDDVIALQAVTRELYIREPNINNYINIMGYNPKYGFKMLDFPYCMYLPQRYNAKYPLWKLKN